VDKGWILIELLPQQLINGLTIGSVYALIALGYTMVYGVLQLINFAHGDLFMLGAMIAVFVLTGMAVTEALSLAVAIPLLIGVFIVSMTLVAGLGVAIERIAYRPLRNAGRLSPLISALGVSVFLENATMNVVGPGPRFFPEFLPAAQINVFGIVIQDKQILILLVATALMVWLHYLVNHTTFGLAVRATAEDKDAASLMGINVNFIISFTFGLGSALAPHERLRSRGHHESGGAAHEGREVPGGRAHPRGQARGVR
jgi:branched-chain amino acid transport system permease protein